ncbi:MAG: creatininase family protein [Gemmatimonadota bacterium]
MSALQRPWLLSESTWELVRETRYDLAVLPWGATEPHNLHLPFGTDTMEAEGVAAEAARLAWDGGARVVVLPAVPFGVNSTQLGLGPTLHVSPSTQLQLLFDVLRSLEAAEIPRLAICNGHGGNDFKPLIREAQLDSDVFLCTFDWWRAVDARGFFDEPGDHAGELETSVMLALRPDLVLPKGRWGTGASRRFKVTGFNEGWAWAPRDWRAVTDDTGVGDPHAATADSGRAFLAAACTRIAAFLVELASTALDDLYE